MTETTAQITATKRCTKCGKEKQIDDFYSTKNTHDGKLSSCKDCTKEARKEWGRQNRVQQNRKERERYAKNPEAKKEKRREAYRKWYAKKENRAKRLEEKKIVPDTDDYSDLLPLADRDVAFRSWAVITSQEYAKELTIWQIADMLDGYDDCAINDWDINGGKHD